VRYDLTLVRMAIIKKTKTNKKNKCLQECRERGKQSMAIPQKPKKELPYDPAVSLLGIYSKEMRSLHQKDTCTFTAVLFTVAKIWNRLNVHWRMNG
jgi:hypothetical protein